MPMPVRNLMRAMNYATILHTIRTSEMISRIDIARSTGLSQASVTGLTADLIKQGLIIEKKTGEYEGGRRPMLLALNPDGAYVVGVNLAIEEISAVIVNFEGSIKTFRSMKLEPVHHSVEDIADLIIREVQACIWEASYSKDQISGVGIGIPGLVDRRSGRILFLPNYNWENANLLEIVQKKLNHPTYIDNSSNTLAIAEQWFGHGKGVDNFLVVTIENGVGLGGVIQGRLYRGNEGTAGEFGHITLDPEGPSCRCGKKGCVEAYAGNNSILRDAKKAFQRKRWQPGDPEKITYDGVVDMALDGVDPLRRIFVSAGHMLGMGIAHLINLYNPAKIIITGKGVKAGNMLFDSMYQAIPTFISAKFGQPATEIVIQQWTDKDWARGAGTLVLQELYKSPVSEVASNQVI